MLDPFSRIAIVAVAVVCAAYSVVYAPARARGSSDEPVPFPVQAAALPGDGAATIIPIARDPFAQPAAAPGPTTPAASATRAAAGWGSPHIDALPSNLASDLIPAIPGGAADAVASASRVTAVVTGAHPYAMVETGGVHEIKGLGDRIGGSPIVAIDLDGIRLQNGARLAVDPGLRP